MRRLLPGVVVAIAIGGLLVHARHYDFVCDDAFIALRQAQNLALHGAPVYNLGERVEVATSPLWMLLLAVGLLAHVEPVHLLQGLSMASGALLVVATWDLVRVLLPGRVTVHAVLLAALAMSTPIAVWSSGGLEAALFAATVTFAFARIEALARTATNRAAWIAGAALGLACFVRLEGLVLVAAAAFALRKIDRRLLARAIGVALAPVAALTVFRLAYYGLPLPHTFYAKTAGVGFSRLYQGLRYEGFAVFDLGVVECGFLLAAPFAARSTCAIAARIFVPVVVLWVAAVGGDFLDFYRFFVPVLPVLFTLFAAAVVERLDRTRLDVWPRAVLALVLLVPHALRQRALSVVSESIDDHARLFVGIEPLGWTKRAAREWSATGRWIARVAESGDSVATSAAGAMPFYSGLPAFDLLGIASPEVIRSGNPLFNRAGHTHQATVEQIERRAPTFIYLVGDPASWRDRGYDELWVDVGEGFTADLVVKKDRAAALATRPEVRRP